jgi:hypothetical protein
MLRYIESNNGIVAEDEVQKDTVLFLCWFRRIVAEFVEGLRKINESLRQEILDLNTNFLVWETCADCSAGLKL